MAAKLEKLEGNKAKLELNVSADKFEEGIAKAYQKLKREFEYSRIPQRKSAAQDHV